MEGIKSIRIMERKTYPDCLKEEESSGVVRAGEVSEGGLEVNL